MGISAGPPGSDCGPASASSAGTLSGTLQRSRRRDGSVPAAEGARRPEDGAEREGGGVRSRGPGPWFERTPRTHLHDDGSLKVVKGV